MSRFSQASLWKELALELPAPLRESCTIRAAYEIAYEAHSGQFRAERDQGRARIPYIVHPVGVAKLAIANWQEGELEADLTQVVSTALLHDVLEDSSFEYLHIAERTSPEIADLTRQLTKPAFIDGQQKGDRNRIFASQIVRAGPAAVYVKICDAIHNLSRPQGMPTTLLKKSVAKAERAYLPMLKNMPFEARMATALRSMIATCREAAVQREEEEREFDPFDFASVVTHIEQASGTKLLEIHDLLEILAQIPGVTRVLYGLPAALGATMSADYPGFGPAFWQEAVVSGIAEIRSVSRLAKLERDPPKLPFTHIIRLGEVIHGRSGSSDALMIAYSEAAVPSWFKLETVAAIVQLSTGKIHRHMQDAALSIQKLGKKYGIDLDLEAIRELDISEQDIVEYVQARETGHIFLSQISHLVEDLARRVTQDRPPQIQSRVKSLMSLIEKKRRHDQVLSSDVEDFLGLRLICISREEACAIARSIRKAIEVDVPVLSPSVEICGLSVKNINSASGYKATHIAFEIRGANFIAGRLGLEIQVRTIFQHAWAQVSEAIRYKQRVTGRQAIDKHLRILADRRDEAEDVVAALAGTFP